MQILSRLPERIFFVALALGFAAISYLYHTEINHRIEYAQQSQITMAKGLLQAAKSAKEQYAKTVVNNIGQFNFETPQSSSNGMPFPFTFAKETGHLINQSMGSLHSRIYSNYPFPGRRTQILDIFQKKALNALVIQRKNAYWAIEKQSDNTGILRYAEPIIMSKACIRCHNDPKFELTRLNWKAGDIRGVWEISMPVDPRVTHPHDFSDVIFVLLAGSLVTAGFVGVMHLKSHHRQRNALASLSMKLGREALQFEKAANTDALTGLGNRRFFEKHVTEAISPKQPHLKKIGLLLIDLDHFKNINDKHGHDVGDQVLIAVSRTLRDIARKQDGVFRVGGEEFAMIISDINENTLAAMGERIREAISRVHLPTKDDQIVVRTSVGGALSREQDTISDLYKRADLALYAAKENGRNQIQVSGHTSFVPQLNSA